MKKYINGYDKFQIRMISAAGVEKIYNFTFKYQALREYYEKISTVDLFTDGSKEKKVHFLNYEWRIFYNEGIESSDLLKFGEIEDVEKQGGTIFLMPHVDYPWREVEVIILDEKRLLDLMHHRRGNDSTLNYGYEISFVNKLQITNMQMVDPNIIPIITAIGCEEF